MVCVLSGILIIHWRVIDFYESYFLFESVFDGADDHFFKNTDEMQSVPPMYFPSGI